MSIRIVIVCHGNINRSALSATIARRLGGAGLEIRSAGFVNPGRRAAKKMREAAAARGYDLEDHRSQLADRDMLLWADLIVYMDGGNFRRLRELLNGNFPRVTARCLGIWATPPVDRIPDPAFMAKGSSEFEAVVELIEEATRNMVQELIG